MGLLSGFEKFGVTEENQKDLYAKPAPVGESAQIGGGTEKSAPKETDFILDKSIRCPVCDGVFRTKMVKSARVKRLDPDFDLRPNHEYIDTLKYGVASCPKCGYTALHKYFPNLSQVQIKLIKENICSKHTGIRYPEDPGTISYEQAIDMYKFALANTIVKRGHASEIAYIALNIAWLERTYIPLLPDVTEFDAQQKEEMMAEQQEAYEQAYRGLMKAVSEENFPIAGMDENTLDYLLANMAFHLGEIENASKLIGRVLSSKTATARMKDRALEMKQEIVNEIKASKK